MKWLDVVKKHLKLNPGKSLRDVMPAVKKEYYGLVGKPTKSHKSRKSKKSRKSRKSKKSRKSRRGRK